VNANLAPPSHAFLFCLLSASVAAADGLPRNWPMAPSELEKRFAREDFTVRKAEETSSGITGALKLVLAYPDGKELEVKWKSVPPGDADGWNNAPRKELATYEIQKLIVDENDYMVPTVGLSCLPMEKFQAVMQLKELADQEGGETDEDEKGDVDDEVRPSLPGSSCVLGVLAVWMKDVRARERFENLDRFRSDPLYARYLADFNVLTYLVDHRDGREGNLLESTIAGDPRVYAVDNGLAFATFPWNMRVANWWIIRVPWLRRDTIDRLRKVDKPRLQRLGVLAELEADALGVYRVVASGPNDNTKEGVRVRGNRVQFGLKPREIDQIHDRIQSLLKRIDSGRIAVH